MIGLAAAVLLLFSGDILGASGIVSSVGLSPLSSLKDHKEHWKLVLLASFLLTSHLFLAPNYQDKDDGLASLSWAAYLVGGFFVGFGTRLGNGCTSGHGICGLARFSKRSLVAVLTFMSVGILTAYFTQLATTPFSSEAFGFLRQDPQDHPLKIWNTAGAVVAFCVALVALVASSFHAEEDAESISCKSRAKLAPAAVSGALFAGGLYVSQMVYPVRVFGFLNLGLMAQGDWDATLAFVMGGGVLVSFASYQLVENHSVLSTQYVAPVSKPFSSCEGSTFGGVPTNSAIDRDLVLGAMCFGLGWGISGLCPGPAMAMAAVGVSWVLVCYWPAFFLGAFLASQLKGKKICGASSPPSSQEAEDDKTERDVGSTVLFEGFSESMPPASTIPEHEV